MTAVTEAGPAQRLSEIQAEMLELLDEAREVLGDEFRHVEPYWWSGIRKWLDAEHEYGGVRFTLADTIEETGAVSSVERRR